MSKYNEEVRLQNLKEFVDEYANEEELTSVDGVRATIDIIEEQLNNYKKLLNANPSEALECLEKIIDNLDDYADFEIKQEANEYIDTIKQALLKAQEQEKENELLKEIIKGLFDKGCPLHQYTDKDFGLTIEVDNECSIMHLGKFNGVDLDKKLKEVLDNE